MLFDLSVTQSNPPEEVRHQAEDLLASVVAQQARLALDDVARRREYLTAQRFDGSQNDFRMLEVDVARSEGLVSHLTALANNAKSEAVVRLPSLLRLLDGPVEQLEFSFGRLSARVRPEQLRGHKMRILLVPDERRRRRVQIQDIGRFDPSSLRHATPRCYGEMGQAYIGWALNRMDVSSLILVALAYLRMN